MNLFSLLAILCTLSVAWGWPARMDPTEAGDGRDAQMPNADPSLMSSLTEISDMGGQHAEGGEARNRRFLWPYWPRYYGYYGYYYRPWGYRYWW